MKLTKTMREAFVHAALADVPQIDYREQIQKLATAAAVAQLPPAVAQAYKQFPEFIETKGVYAANRYVYVPGVGQITFSAETQAKLVQLEGSDKKQKETINALKTKLTAAAYSVTTRKALVALLPEFEKYLPPDEATATRNLPAIANLVAEFSRAGWPKNQVAA